MRLVYYIILLLFFAISPNILIAETYVVSGVLDSAKDTTFTLISTPDEVTFIAYNKTSKNAFLTSDSTTALSYDRTTTKVNGTRVEAEHLRRENPLFVAEQLIGVLFSHDRIDPNYTFTDDRKTSGILKRQFTLNRSKSNNHFPQAMTYFYDINDKYPTTITIPYKSESKGTELLYEMSQTKFNPLTTTGSINVFRYNLVGKKIKTEILLINKVHNNYDKAICASLISEWSKAIVGDGRLRKYMRPSYIIIPLSRIWKKMRWYLFKYPLRVKYPVAPPPDDAQLIEMYKKQHS